MLVMGNVKCLHCGFETGRGRSEGLATHCCGLRNHELAEAKTRMARSLLPLRWPRFLDDASLVINSTSPPYSPPARTDRAL